MPEKPTEHASLISVSEGGSPKVVMVQETESSEDPASAPKVCPDDEYDPSQQVLSVSVRHTYNADPENLEGNLENQLTNHLHHNDADQINEGGSPKVVVEQETESSEGPASVPKDSSDDEQYDSDPSQQVLSVSVRHTYNADPENLEGNLENQLTNHRHHNDADQINGQYTCASCGRVFVIKTRYKKHIKYSCGGKYSCSSCGKKYHLKMCYEKHLKFLCEVIKKTEPKDAMQDIVELPRLRARKPANQQLENSLGFMAPVPDKRKEETSKDASSDCSSNAATEASELWDAEDKTEAGPNSEIFTCSSCGKQYKYKSWYDRHRSKKCDKSTDNVSSDEPAPAYFPVTVEMAWEPPQDNDCYIYAGPWQGAPDPAPRVQQWVIDTVPTDQLVFCCTVPYCGQSFMDEWALLDHQREHSDHGPEIVGNKRRQVEGALGDQAVRGPSGSSASSPEPHTDYLSMIQISNVKSLVSSDDDVLPVIAEETATSTAKDAEPEDGSSSSRSRGQGAAPHSEKKGCRSWVPRSIRNRMRATQKWLLSGGRRAVCLLCGRRFGRNAALDQHVASVHCERFRYRCGSCNMSFKARTCLCRHVLQAHCDLKKLKCCSCKRRYRAAHILQRHILKQHSSGRRRQR